MRTPAQWNATSPHGALLVDRPTRVGTSGVQQSAAREILDGSTGGEVRVAKGVSINKQAIAKMQRDLQREFDKHPIHVPINAETTAGFGRVMPTTVNHYHAPVVTVHGDHAQVAWGDGAITQGQGDVSPVAEGYEALAQLLAAILAKLPELGLNTADAQDARANAESVLAEVVKRDPDKSALRRGATMLRGLLASAGTGLNQAITAESAEFAREAIDALTKATA